MLSVFSAVLSAIFLFDTISWFATGYGIHKVIVDSPDSPILVAIASHLMYIPHWAFWGICAVSVVVLAMIFSMAMISSLQGGKKE